MAWQGSLRLGLDDMMGAMGPDNGGGAIDALLIEFDPDTGEPMPCYTEDGQIYDGARGELELGQSVRLAAVRVHGGDGGGALRGLA